MMDEWEITDVVMVTPLTAYLEQKTEMEHLDVCVFLRAQYAGGWSSTCVVSLGTICYRWTYRLGRSTGKHYRITKEMDVINRYTVCLQ
jgi:hypothetical protein